MAIKSKAEINNEQMRVSHEHKHISLVLCGMGWVLQGMIAFPLKSCLDTIKHLSFGKEEFKLQAGKIPNTWTAVPQRGINGILKFSSRGWEGSQDMWKIPGEILGRVWGQRAKAGVGDGSSPTKSSMENKGETGTGSREENLE